MNKRSRIRIDVPHDRLAKFCQRHHIRRLAFFGSVLRRDFNPKSDIDILVEFEPDYHVGFIKLAGMEIELSELLGRKVDLRTPGDLSRYFRQDVVENAEVAYVQG